MTKINASLLNLHCPPFMRNLPGWLVWRLEKHEGEEKARKVPYYAGGGRRVGQQGSDDDRGRLVTFDAAIAAAAKKNFTGVGFAPMPEFGITALDYDHVVGTQWQKPIEEMLAGTYAEFSPSGAGIRAFVRGTLPNRKSHAGDKWPYTFETFGSKGFVTFTGMALSQCELLGGDVDWPSDGVRSLLATRFTPTVPEGRAHTEAVVGLKDEQLAAILASLDPNMPYDDWVKVGMALHHETNGEGYELFDEWSQGGADYKGREETGRKWESYGKRSDGQNLTGRYLLKLGKGAGVSVGGPVASAEDFEIVGPRDFGEISGEINKSRFEVVSVGEFSRRPAPGWVVKNLIPRADLVVVFGASGSGKSFVVTDLAMAIARGIPWRGLKVRQGRVVYIAAEGGGGYRNRVRAYAEHTGVDLDQVPFGVIHAAPNFMLKDDVKAVQEAIAAAEGADLIVVDTFAQVTPGANENAGEDMGKALKHARMIGDATGAVVVLVHHSGKDEAKGSRGWSGIRAAADAELEVVRTDKGRFLRTTKQKEGDDQGEWGFRLQQVRIGEDEDGEPIESCVVLEDGVPADAGKGARKKRLGKWEMALLDALAARALGGGMIARADLVGDAVEARMVEGLKGEPDTLRANANRALEGLARSGHVGLKGPIVFEITG